MRMSSTRDRSQIAQPRPIAFSTYPWNPEHITGISSQFTLALRSLGSEWLHVNGDFERMSAAS